MKIKSITRAQCRIHSITTSFSMLTVQKVFNGGSSQNAPHGSVCEKKLSVVGRSLDTFNEKYAVFTDVFIT
jgi:hypothetical protein